ncbi:MAG: ATP-dependent Clp protease proteolytic subunit [Candidatus Woesebacteria bacterium]|nr:MAG: ATP-dependent Clp protease proteolytic subunit [Candidatus Woesebacteria bacterium]
MPKVKKQKRKNKVISSTKKRQTVSLMSDYFILFSGVIDKEPAERLLSAMNNAGKNGVGRIVIFFSSFGGSIYHGFQLATIIQNSKIPIVIHATNHIDSIANVVYLSAKQRSAESHAKFYLHGASTTGSFNERELKDALSATQTNNSRIAYFISENTNLPLTKVKSLMEEGVTISAQDALKYGIANEVIHKQIPNGVLREDIIYID